MAGAISQDWERCQFPFVLDEKNHGCSGRSGRKAVEKGMKGSLLRRSVEVRASRAVGLRWQLIESCPCVERVRSTKIRNVKIEVLTPVDD